MLLGVLGRIQRLGCMACGPPGQHPHLDQTLDCRGDHAAAVVVTLVFFSRSSILYSGKHVFSVSVGSGKRLRIMHYVD